MALIPFVPVGTATERQNLTAWMTASSDYGNQSNPYGTLTVYETPPGQTVDGPGLISSIIHTNPAISSELTLLNQQGSNVELGEVVVVPLDQTLLYVQTIYVESSSNQIPTLKDVVVVYNGKAYHSSNASLDNALCQITNPDGSQPFSSYCNTAAAAGPPRCPAARRSTGTGTGTAPSRRLDDRPCLRRRRPLRPAAAGGRQSVTSLLAQAQTSFNAADAALRSGDLAAYQADVQQAEAYVQPGQGPSPPSRRANPVAPAALGRRLRRRLLAGGGSPAGPAPARGGSGRRLGRLAPAAAGRPLARLGGAGRSPGATWRSGGAHSCSAPAPRAHRIDALIRGPAPAATLGTACSHVA